MSIMSTHLQAKQLIRSTTSIFSISWEMQYKENGHGYGQLVIGSFVTTTRPLMHHFMQSFLTKHQITQVTQPCLQPKLGTLRLLAFPKTKITFEREEISGHQWDLGKYDRTADGNSNKRFCRVFWRDAGKTVWGPKVPTLKGTDASFSYVQGFLYL